ncbi:MAG: nucleoside hydrolase [Erysipelotrichaceae bacterium]|nr:nucleoside hydrolase [Erysipelotrichaceae bacterium]
MNKIPVWIDTDCGVDDALAILCALKLEELDIVGMSSGVGTTTHENTFRNTRNVLKLAGREDIRVYPGADSSWIDAYRPAPAYHGENGLGDVILEDSDVLKETEHAWDAIYEKAKELGHELTVVTIGQLTNLATALVKYPDLKDHVKQISIMGGAIDGGNTTPCSEANIVRDPYAAQCVFKSDIPIRLFPLDVTEKVFLTPDELDGLKQNKVTDFLKEATKIAIDTNRRNGYGDSYCMHDLCPVMELVHPELFSSRKAGVYVETRSELSYGKTVSDLYVLSDHTFEHKNADIYLEADRESLVRYVINILESY